MRLGTSSIVVAAFVGPGTVLTCASAGIRFGYALGWVLLFSTVAVFVLQSFTAATGILARRGVGEALRETLRAPLVRAVAYALVVLGLFVGCAAFEMGNLLGAASGIAALFGHAGEIRVLILAVAGMATLFLLLDLRALLTVFTGLVVLMSALFVGALLLSPVDWSAALHGLTHPAIPEDGILTVIALVGTTVVTYNLFLHAGVTKAYWRSESDAPHAFRLELGGMALFLPVGGFVSFAILATGAGVNPDGEAIDQVGAFATLLEPVAGHTARILFGLGLFGAGITSAMTAPLAAATGMRELFGWPDDRRDLRYRLVWGAVIASGLFFALFEISPLKAIIAAQAANGILLPLIAGFVLYVSMRQTALSLPTWVKALGILVTLVCAVLGTRTLWWAWTQIVGG